MNNEFIVKDSPVIDRNYCEQSACSSRYIARVLIHQQPELVPTHWHAGLEMNYVIEGSGTVTIGSKVEALYPGKMCIISPYELHSFVEEKRNGKNPLIISMTYDDVRLRQVYNLVDNVLLSPNAPQATDADRAQFIDLCMQIYDLTSAISAERSLKINALLFEIAYLTFRKFTVGSRKQPITQHGQNIMQPIFGYIDAHKRHALRAQDVASYFGYSREYFSRLFKANSSITFKEYLTTLRLEDAYYLLMYQYPGSLNDIARQTGFASARSFIAVFKEHYGMHPLQYRKQYTQ